MQQRETNTSNFIPCTIAVIPSPERSSASTGAANPSLAIKSVAKLSTTGGSCPVISLVEVGPTDDGHDSASGNTAIATPVSDTLDVCLLNTAA